MIQHKIKTALKGMQWKLINLASTNKIHLPRWHFYLSSVLNITLIWIFKAVIVQQLHDAAEHNIH